MHITVRPRYVAAPWEPESTLRIVGLEDDVTPEAGPLELYLRTWPDRSVRWDRAYQSFAIYAHPLGANEQLLERVTYWDAPVDPKTGEELEDEEIARRAGRDPNTVRRFMPFDYPFVHRRMKDRLAFLDRGADKFRQRIADRNAQLARTFRRDKARDMAAAANEIKDWLPVLTEFEQTGRLNTGMRTARGRGASFSAESPAPAAPAAPPQLIIASR
jgi:hypothetical protein